ncbi:hypothetical protein HG536_0A02550 [Torulaspora globosa]|uniref:Uncharacterized protein n=1 Tax=Torulaspora globosa TaxID=48254 RepID=A0A7G3ZAA2_9SACH|nr:uncharacterized protein HG536_0A02550 [Torulaspora globosa]QLL30438.1 hypothetical protein HG536_0A02550 [Torulaspora globosa]
MERFWWIVSMFAFVAGSSVPSDHVGFVLEAVKSAYRSGEQDLDRFCFELESPFVEPTSEFLFVIDVVDTLPFHTDPSRFGGTNVDRDKQSLDMTIHDCANGDLIRSRRRLASGTSVIEVSPSGSRKFCFCFVNLSYDSSWKFIDVIKTITVRMAAHDSIQKRQRKSQLVKEMALESLQQTERSIRTLLGLADSGERSELLELESERRDLNEEVFNRLLCGEAAFTVAVIASNLLLTRHFIRRHRDRIRDARRNKRFNH